MIPVPLMPMLVAVGIDELHGLGLRVGELHGCLFMGR